MRKTAIPFGSDINPPILERCCKALMVILSNIYQSQKNYCEKSNDLKGARIASKKIIELRRHSECKTRNLIKSQCVFIYIKQKADLTAVQLNYLDRITLIQNKYDNDALKRYKQNSVSELYNLYIRQQKELTLLSNTEFHNHIPSLRSKSGYLVLL